MSQASIYECLKKSNEPLAAQEIASQISSNTKQVCAAIRQMIKYREVGFVEIDRFEAKIRYNSKRRMKLYFII